MLIIPAIDLKDGRCVRLRQGRAEQVAVYSEDPVEVAVEWQAQGAEYLHVVDLDGAFTGKPVHTAVIAGIAARTGLPFEVGGGLRTDDDIRAVLDAGADRVIVGTRAFTDTGELARMAGAFGKRLAVGIDARGGMVQVKGWVETTGMRAIELGELVAAAGVATIIYTDTATDGMMSGPNIEAVQQMCSAVNCDVVASGGITTAEDTRALRRLGMPNLVAAIVGKALYEGRVTLADLVSGGK
jgi:phosphoribosylformimino-5-aminoimidazole carboxamide ribotide isomerase